MAFASSVASTPARADLDLQDFDGRYTRVDGDHLTIIPISGNDYVDKAYLAGSFTEKSGSCHFSAMGNWHYPTKIFTINAGDGCHLQLLVDAQAFRFTEGPSGVCSQRLCNGGLSWNNVKIGRNTGAVHVKTTHDLRVEVMATPEYHGFWESLGAAVGSVFDFLAPVPRQQRSTHHYGLDSVEEVAATHPKELKKRGKSVHVEVDVE